MRIELDTVVESNETINDVIAEMTKDLDVEANLVAEHGPAGGHPLIAYIGTEADLRTIARRYGPDTEETIFA
jgi:hypothetical protein